MKKKFVVPIILIPILLMLACIGGDINTDKPEVLIEQQTWVPVNTKEPESVPAVVTQEPEATPQPEATPEIKKIVISIRNNSGQACYLDPVPMGYFDDVDGVFIGSLVVEAGGIRRQSFNVEEAIQSGYLVETSPTTYEMTFTIAWGALPSGYPEHKNIDTGDLTLTTFTLSGTYTTDIYNADLDPVIVWDGFSFKQVK